MADDKKPKFPLDGIAVPEAFRELDRVAKVFDAAGIAAASRGLHEQLGAVDRMTKFFPYEHLMGLAAARRVYHEQFSDLGRMARLFAEEQSKIAAAVQAAGQFGSITSRFAEQMKGVNALGEQFAKMNSTFADQAFAFSRLADRMRPIFPEPIFPALDRKLFEAITPSAALLGTLGEYSGVLTNIEGVDDVVGTVSWVGPVGDIHAAGILDHPRGGGERLDIEVAVKCGLCGELMPVPQHSTEWQSPTKAKIDVKVLPVCVRCVHEVQGSPEYWIEKLDELQRPQLKLVRGEGESPEAKGRDHLRLVDDREDEE